MAEEKNLIRRYTMGRWRKKKISYAPPCRQSRPSHVWGSCLELMVMEMVEGPHKDAFLTATSEWAVALSRIQRRERY